MAAAVLQVPLLQLTQPRGAGIGVGRGRRAHPDRQIGEHEIFFVRKGRLGISESGRTLDTAAGESLVLWPHRRHYGTEIVPTGCEFYWLHVLVPSPRTGEPRLFVPQRGRPSRPARVMEILHRYMDDLATGRLTPASGHAFILLLASELGESRAEAPASGRAAHPLATRAEAEIARRFHLPLSTAELARLLGANPDYLGRVYHRSFGRTILDSIASHRVDDAARGLLEEPDLPITEVGRRSGFRNPAWFRRCFRRGTGNSPAAYRRMHGRQHVNS